jgi:hypothetical protein
MFLDPAIIASAGPGDPDLAEALFEVVLRGDLL